MLLYSLRILPRRGNMARVKNNNRATNVAKEYIKDMDKNKVASIILLLFLVVFFIQPTEVQPQGTGRKG